MPAWTGFLHSSGAPAIKVKIAGTFPNLAQEFDAIVDTGFSGFASMPLIQAFPLGLALVGSTNVTLADGSTSAKLTAIASVIVEGEHQAGIVILEPSSNDILLGMSFLHKFGKVLIAHQKRPLMLFVDETDVDTFVDRLIDLKAAADLKASQESQDETSQLIESPSPPDTEQEPAPQD